MTIRLNIAAIAIAMTALVGCSQNQNSITNDGLSALSPSTSQSLIITDATGAPIAGARVMIGMKENVPFVGNVLTTDAQGMIALPAEWTDAQPVTIDAQGYVRATYFATMPQTANLVANRAIAPQRLELKGTAKSFSNVSKDKMMDVALLFPALPRSAVNTLSVGALISPEIDTISVMGQKMEIPSNVAIPKQTEDYILPITIEKDEYRMYLPTPGNWKIAAVHARFPFKKTVDAMRGGKSFFDIINTFEFIEGSINDMAINKTTQSSDISVNSSSFSKAIPFAAPRYDAGFNMLALALSESGGLFYVTDVKNLAPQAKEMLSAPKMTAGQGLIVAALRRQDAPTEGAGVEELSAVTLAANQSVAFDFLPVVKAPAVAGTTLNFDVPRSVATVDAVMTYAILNKIEKVGAGQMKLEQKTARWELFAPAWAPRMDLPELPALPAKAGDKFRWEVTFGGQFTGQPTMSAGPATLGRLSHITRSALDL
ncbi:MAG: carboxypeptidase-like regulatory domain-containing protein [Bdellovibrionota bacterium]